MKMRNAVLIVKDTDYDTEEPGDFRHGLSQAVTRDQAQALKLSANGLMSRHPYD
jgi:hypothetical protein